MEEIGNLARIGRLWERESYCMLLVLVGDEENSEWRVFVWVIGLHMAL